MRLTRNAGINPLQDSLIPGMAEPAVLPGVTAQPVDQERLEGQLARVAAILKDGKWHTLPQLYTELQRRFGQRYSETSISARLRQMRKAGYTVECQRTKPKSGLYQYRAQQIAGYAQDSSERDRTAAVLLQHRGIQTPPAAPETGAAA